MNILSEVREHLSPKRFQHTLGVKDTAIYLARLWKADESKAEIAALLHDWAKEYTDADLLKYAKEFNLPLSEFDTVTPQILHGHVGARMVSERFKIYDFDILSAITYHTLGADNMSLLDKIIFLADMIEPGRDFPEVVRLRELAERNIDEALLAGFDSTINFLLLRKAIIHPQTISSRNHLIRRLLSQ